MMFNDMGSKKDQYPQDTPYTHLISDGNLLPTAGSLSPVVLLHSLWSPLPPGLLTPLLLPPPALPPDSKPGDCTGAEGLEAEKDAEAEEEEEAAEEEETDCCASPSIASNASSTLPPTAASVALALASANPIDVSMPTASSDTPAVSTG